MEVIRFADPKYTPFFMYYPIELEFEIQAEVSFSIQFVH